MALYTKNAMGELTYLMLMSLDGFIADRTGRFDWAEPDEEVHRFVNGLQRPVATYLYGRRLYEVMTAWETLDTREQPAYIAGFAEIWRAADKVVYSRTLGSVSTTRTQLERSFDPDAVGRMKDAAEGDLAIGGPGLAAAAFAAGLVDELHLFVAPIVVGGGTAALPAGVRLELETVDERRFSNGMVYLHHRAVRR